jgi:hypothetical protein
MEDRLWQKRLLPHGIHVEQITLLRDWSESRVIRVKGTCRGKPVIRYLKRSHRGHQTESSIYRFAAHHAGFPASGAVFVMLDGVEWLLLDCAEGTLLADISREDASGAYACAARGIARFHTEAAAAGWPLQLPGLTVMKEHVKALPFSVLDNLRRLVAEGEYSGVDLSLLSQVEMAANQLWPGFMKAYRNYPDSVIHGDCHLGNLFLAPEGGICLIDWASAFVAPGLMDLAALLDVTRRMCEHVVPEPEILAAYFSELSQSERAAYGRPERAWAVCRSVRAFLELEWFAGTGDDYGQRAQRELTLLLAYLHLLPG